MAFSNESLIPGDTGAASSERVKTRTRRCFNRNRTDLVDLFQPLGIEAEFLGHLDQLL